MKAVHWVWVNNSGGEYPAFTQLTEAFPWSLLTILCKCLFLKVTVKAVTKLDNKTAHCHTSVLKGYCPLL
ncbi:hypothetical protein GUO98_004362 [Salmonella enterica]|nr:hypothetical protein [Salmonella enterica]EEJ8658709.1 hypothetical protein [Salmonella enterica subsp. enterica]